MEVLFATTNPAKIANYKENLEKRGIKVFTLKDLGLNVDVDETGKTAVENAKIKAETYGKIAKKITIGIDTSLFLENVPESKQPGTKVRRVNGKRLNDEEMIEYYSSLAKEYGGRILGKWINGVAIYDGKETKTFTYEKSKYYFTSERSQKIREGYPLDSITILPNTDKFLVEMTKEEKNKKTNFKYTEIADKIYEILKNIKEK